MSYRPWLLLVLLAWSLSTLESKCRAQARVAKSQADHAFDTSAEDNRERTIIERFVSLLEKNP